MNFERSYIDPNNTNVFLSQECSEMLRLIVDESDNVSMVNVNYCELGRSNEYYNYIQIRPDLI